MPARANPSALSGSYAQFPRAAFALSLQRLVEFSGKRILPYRSVLLLVPDAAVPDYGLFVWRDAPPGSSARRDELATVVHSFIRGRAPVTGVWEKLAVVDGGL